MNLANAPTPGSEATQQLLGALENQARELTHLLWRLERVRAVLVPGTIESWRGLSRLAFDSALGGLGGTLDDGITTMRSAVDSTRRAISVMNSHG